MLRALIPIACLLGVQALPRDAPPPVTQGTAIIRGRVFAGDRTPIARAVVSLGGTTGHPAKPRSIYTDGKGEFVFGGLTPSSYGLSARPGQYQRRFLGSDRVEVVVTAGQQVENVELVLRPAGVIVGRVVDEFGQPLDSMNVTATAVGSPPGTGGFSGQETDEQGRFRLFSLVPGAYYVIAEPFSGMSDPMVTPSFGFVKTYLPGTTDLDAAVKVDVRAGHETDAGDLRLIHASLMRVSGIVLDASGRPAPSNTTMVTWSANGGSTSRAVDADGRFTFERQPPGSYRLSARIREPSGQSLAEYGSQTVLLTDADADMTLLTRPAVTVTGRVVVEDGRPPAAGTLSVQARAPARDYGGMFIDTAPVTRELTFIVPRIAGEWLLRIEGPGMRDRGLHLKAVMRGDEDVTDVPTEFKASDDVRIVLTSRLSLIQGTVLKESGEPTTGSAVVAVFSDDRRTWVRGSMRVQSGRTDRLGHYSVAVPAGRYYVVATSPDRGLPYDDVDPAILDTLLKNATIVVIGEDEQRQVDVKINSGG